MILFDEIEKKIFNRFSTIELENFCKSWKVGLIIKSGVIVGVQSESSDV